MVRRSVKIMWFQINQNLATVRVILLFLLIFIFIFSSVRPVCDFASAYEIGITPWVFSLITNDYICQLVIMAVAILLFCNAPFKSEAHNYILVRSGNLPWTMGICLYIMLMSFLYVILILAAGIVAILPRLQLDAGWGQTWSTLARVPQFYSQFGISLSVNDYIIGKYRPVEAVVISFVLEWACCTWLGLVTYFFNNATETMAGSVVAAAFVFLDITIENEWSYAFFKISPVTMAQLRTLSSTHSIYHMTLGYATFFFTISISAFVGLCLLTPYVKKQFSFIRQRKVE